MRNVGSDDGPRTNDVRNNRAKTDTVPYSARLRNVGSDDGPRTNDVRNNRGPFSLATTDNTNPHTAVRLNETPQGLIDVMTGGIVL